MMINENSLYEFIKQTVFIYICIDGFYDDCSEFVRNISNHQFNQDWNDALPWSCFKNQILHSRN